MATLTLTVLRCPDSVAADQRTLQGGELTMGRGAECGWPLPDPLKSLSRRHCTLEFLSGAWQVRDQSVNGTFINFSPTPVGRDQAQQLHDGDRLRLGDYEFEVRIEEAAAPAYAPLPGLQPAASPFGTPGLPPVGEPARPGGFAAARLPGLDNPLDAPSPYGTPPRQESAMPDHAPASAYAFTPPQAVPAAKPIIPDDWWQQPAPGPAPAAAPAFAPAAPAPAAYAPVAPQPAPFQPSPAAANPFAAAPAPLPPVAMPAAAAPPPAHLPPLQPPLPPLTPAQAAPLIPPLAAAPAGAPVAGGDLVAALSALMAGAELPPEFMVRAAADPQAALANAGALLRAAVAGVRALLIARGTVKREFRIEQTMLRPRDNNPLKFAASDETALAALLDPRTPALEAMDESIRDLTLHQVATLAATQAAARTLLERLGPAELEEQDTGGGSFLPGAREKRLWDAYKRHHAKLLEQFEDDFESAFGTAFARAYEQAAGRAKN